MNQNNNQSTPLVASDNRAPCRECPFRKNSAPGYLGDFTANETYQTAVSEFSFACHLTRSQKKRRHCIGRLLFASKAGKSFRNPDLEVVRRQVLQDSDTENILGLREFFEHHREGCEK